MKDYFAANALDGGGLRVLLDLVFKCEMIVRSGGRGPLNGMLRHCVYAGSSRMKYVCRVP